ncbi:hypothetical protein BLNAU_19919 [Blattamonas nauphoetae]|uniref:Uncharacterized protein n=1 Tax=Blattamonas nauphoetae TaxID=2049346 RepID=A0ABQ9X1A0_9EUKA|nr:hypothetical protein BLNAU_19919 [Blattamonas nauphoetae]
MLTSSEEYSPFLNWNPTEKLSLDSVAHAFLSLVSMVRDAYPFDEKLAMKVNLLFQSSFLIKAIGRGSPDNQRCGAAWSADANGTISRPDHSQSSYSIVDL